MKINVDFLRQDNPRKYDKIYRKLYAREYYKVNREKCIAYRKEYREKHKKYYEEYREKHREHYNELARQQGRTDKGRLYKKYHYYKYSDKRRNHFDSVDYTFEEFLCYIAVEQCYYCGSIHNLGLDRIDNTKGHSRVNTNVVCGRCNKLRSNDFAVEEFKLIGKALQQIDNNRNISKNT